MSSIKVYKRYSKTLLQSKASIWNGDTLNLLTKLPKEEIFDLAITSPPYNINKEYEKKLKIEEYFKFHRNIIEETSLRLKKTGSICWQVGNYTEEKDQILPLDYGFHEIFSDLGFKLQNRIVWRFGHGLHRQNRFSGRYEIILWYVKSNNYTWNLDDVRVPQKYPGKKSYHGPNKGKLSGNPKGKNPEDVWDIPNVKGNHVEKTMHPCQFPVALVERLVLALTNPGDLVFDPFMGVGSSGVAALNNNRRFLGSDSDETYSEEAKKRLQRAIRGEEVFREDEPIYDPRKSNLSQLPEEWKK